MSAVATISCAWRACRHARSSTVPSLDLLAPSFEPSARKRLHTNSTAQNQQSSLLGPFNVIFAGSDAFASVVLQEIVRAKELYTTLHVLTPSDAPNQWGGKRMRTSSVKQLSRELNLSHQDVPPDGMDSLDFSDCLGDRAALRADSGGSSSSLLITVSFGHFIPPSLLSKFPTPSHCLNLHPSLLPLLRGAAPIQWALARQLKTTGVTVQQLSPDAYDRGKILGQEEVPIPSGSSYIDMEKVLAEHGAQLLVDTLRNLPSRHKSARPQDDNLATHAIKVRRSHVDVRWDRWDAQEVEARSRAFGYLVRSHQHLSSHLSLTAVPTALVHALLSQYPLCSTLTPSGSTVAAPLRVILPQVSLLPTASDLATLDPRADALLSPSSTSAGSAILSRALNAVIIKCISGALGAEPTYLLARSLKSEGKRERLAADWWIGYQDRADKDGRLKFERRSK